MVRLHLGQKFAPALRTLCTFIRWPPYANLVSFSQASPSQRDPDLLAAQKFARLVMKDPPEKEFDIITGAIINL